MPRPRTSFTCVECGHESARWAGRCPGCSAWNSLIEEVRATRAEGAGQVRRAGAAASLLGAAPGPPPERVSTGLAELDRVLGGGVVPGSAVLVGGEPGIGKSTLLLQSLAGLAASAGPALYVSAEESEDQVRMRAARLGIGAAPDLYLLSDTNLEAVVEQCERLHARVIVADSVQTLWSERLPAAPGSVGQVREVAARLLALCKTGGAVAFLVGHVTKDGAIAGPRTLEHMVDTVVYFEGDRGRAHRVVRAIKNRFGPAGEIGVFEMREEGLRGVEDASAQLLAERAQDVPGSAVLAAVEGSRALLVEVQALASDPAAGIARRTANGFDPSRLSLLLAVLESRVRVPVAGRDLFLNVVGGLDLAEPAADLAVVAAAASAARGVVVDPDTIVFGEVGLMGEVRGVGRADLRLAEASRHGFRRAVIPVANAAEAPAGTALEVHGVTTVGEALRLVLGYPASRGPAAAGPGVRTR